MKWCIFVDRRCYGEECVGWIKDNCFIYLLLPGAVTDKQLQAEFDWSQLESYKMGEDDLSGNGDTQISFLDELEKLIVHKNSNFREI
ncbi:MAG: hypothetical protein ABFD82_12320 [Syntrophaceae bacterium]